MTMKTCTEREADFRKDFKLLMEKHKATFDVVDCNEYGDKWVKISIASECDDEMTRTAQYHKFWISNVKMK